MRPVLLLPSLCLVLTAAAPPSATRIGLVCSGPETVRSGQGAPTQARYDLTLSIDLDRKLYCYGACGREQSFAMKDAASMPLKLADVETPSQSRHLLFDRASMMLSDDQRISLAALPAVERHARISCQPAPFHEPPSP